MKLAIDRYIAGARPRRRRPDRARVTSAILLGVVRASSTLQTWTAADDRAADHVRHAACRSTGTCSGSTCSSTTAIPVGRLMTRVTTDVDVLNDLFTSGVVSIFGDVFTLARHHDRAAVRWTGGWRSSPSPCCRSSSLVTQWFRRNVRESYRTVRALDRAHQRVPAGAHHRHVDGAAVPPRGARASTRFDEINRRAPRRQHRLDLLLRGVLSRRSRSSARSPRR